MLCHTLYKHGDNREEMRSKKLESTVQRDDISTDKQQHYLKQMNEKEGLGRQGRGAVYHHQEYKV
eukprot:6186777-Pleurochrysis_carterae.AAC.7